ncbi:MAG: DUF4157 domain-containing protein [Nostoc sp.]
MTSKRIAQTNQQQKSEKPQTSGILQRAAVRSSADAEVQSTDDKEVQPLSNSALSKGFSRVPISTTKPQPFQARNLQSHPMPPIQAKMTQGKGEMTGDLEAQHPNKTGLPYRLKTGFENLSGLSMDDVRVHYNSPKPAQLNALAYTQGTEIHVAPGQEKHLPHEVGHVVQQKQGRVKPTILAKGVAINDDRKLEKEADDLGKKAARGEIINNRLQNIQFKADIQKLHKLECCCPSCVPIQQKNQLTQQNQQLPFQLKFNPLSGQKIVIQRLNNKSAQEASNEAVQEVEKEYGTGESSLLSGWGKNWITGHEGRNFTAQTTKDIDNIGNTYGCACCGTKKPGTQNGHFIPDHQPPNALVAGGYNGAIRFYAHCKSCSDRQTGTVTKYKAKMKKIRDATDSDWATGIQGSWFWN